MVTRCTRKHEVKKVQAFVQWFAELKGFKAKYGQMYTVFVCVYELRSER